MASSRPATLGRLPEPAPPAFFFSTGTPREIVLKMNKAINADDRAHMKKRMDDFGLTVPPPQQRTPEYLATFLPKDTARCGKAIRDAGLAGMAGVLPRRKGQGCCRRCWVTALRA